MDRRARGLPPSEVEPLELRPRGTTVIWWSLLGTIVTAAGVYFVIDSDGNPLAWAALAVFVVVAAYFVSQLVVPSLVRVRLDAHGLRAHAFGRQTEVPWERVRLARVRQVFGESLLMLDVYEPAGDGWRHRVVRVLLPLDCDLSALHRFLHQRLGRGGQLQPPIRVRPLDRG